jgi:hypothetical protein
MKKAVYETPEFSPAGSFRKETGLSVFLWSDRLMPGII